MLDVLWEAIRPINLPFTALLGLVTFYWLLVLAGVLDFDTEPGLDVGHVGADLHVDGDVHVEASHDVATPDAAEGLQGAVKSALQFLNFGDVPAMIVVSIMSLSLWTWSMVANHYFSDGSIIRSLVLILPNLALTIVLTRLLTTPLKRLFNALNREYEEHKPVVGRTCTIVTSEVTDKFGQAQIETSGAPLLLNVRTYGETVLSKGETALIIKEDKENNIFTVAKLTTTTPQQETQIC